MAASRITVMIEDVFSFMGGPRARYVDLGVLR
jgi:hypothetical protein